MYEDLIKRLREESLYKDKATLEIMDICMEAADALENLDAQMDVLVKEDIEAQQELAGYRDLGTLEHLRELVEAEQDGMPLPEPPEEDEKMIEETRKPRICDLLGVDVGEWFGFDYPHKKYEKCCVNVDGKIVEMWNTGKLHNVGGNAVCWIINHPDCVIRRPHFTDEEMAALRVLYDSGARWLARGKHLRWYAHEPYRRPDDGKWDMQGCWGTMSGKLPAKLFHSVLPGQSVPLLDIIEEATP